MNKSNSAALIAIILWATLAVSATALLKVPIYFQLGWSFLIGSLPILLRSQWQRPLIYPLVVGLTGVLGYHLLLFNSFRFIPPVTANLINYLWPILIVLLAPFFQRDQKWQWRHFIGASGAALGFFLLTSGPNQVVSANFTAGVLMALGAAILWAVYSLLQKRFKGNDSLTLGLVCLLSGSLFLVLSSLFETSVSLDTKEIFILVWMGIGPFGVAFFLWEWALKNGNSQKIGTMAYMTPVLSTLFLALGTNQRLSIEVISALGLITVSALISGFKK